LEHFLLFVSHTGGSQPISQHSSTRQTWNFSCCLLPTPAVLNLYHSILPRDKLGTFPAVCYPHRRFSIYITAFFHATKLELFLLFVLSVRNRLAAPPLLQGILSGYGVESRGSGAPLPAGALAPIFSAKLRPTQPVHAMGHWDYFPDGKAAVA
jgi:hypothetical protein